VSISGDTSQIKTAVVTGNHTYADPHSRRFLARGIRWAANRI
jgi:hypothetical protein